MVGLGDIARKAYLPTLAVRDDIRLHLVTRDSAVREALGRRWRIADLHADIDAALASGPFDAAFVHAATQAHPALVERLIAARVPVFVDKPLADRYDAAARLAEQADRAGVPLFVGFNRRYAPPYADLRDRPRSLLRMDKHRRGPPHPARRTVFDDFIHVVDTMRFLSPVPVEVAAIETVMRGDGLEAVLLVLTGAGFVATGAMHRDGGLDEERLEIIGDGVGTVVRDLADTIESRGAERRTRRCDWTPVTRQRGFDAMCDAFLAIAAAGRPCPLEDMLETHRLCELIVARAEHSASMVTPYLNRSPASWV